MSIASEHKYYLLGIKFYSIFALLISIVLCIFLVKWAKLYFFILKSKKINILYIGYSRSYERVEHFETILRGPTFLTNFKRIKVKSIYKTSTDENLI
jgi:hypothetical protein